VSYLPCIGLIPAFSFLATSALGQQQATCEMCHVAEASQFSSSVHSVAAVSCRDCHGGEQTYLVDNQQLTSPSFDHGASFTGKPTRFEIPEKCAQCHADVSLMNPYGLPADQLMRYRTSGHGKALFEKKNAKAAVCTDCHDVHAIFKANDPRSRTHPLNVPDTCGRCHGDEALMSDHGLSVEIVHEYQASVHGRGLLEAQDTGMPTCASCHGNHAAAPPGVESVDAVCGRCHQQADQFFLQSPHAAIDSFARCIACHGGENSHAIQRVTIRPQRLVALYANVDPGSEDPRLIEALHPGLSLMTEACYECHDEDSDDPSDIEAIKRAAQFYRMIGESEVAYAQTAGRVAEVSRGVLLVEDEQLMMADATTAVIEMGPTQHTLNLEELAAVVARLHTTTDAVNASIDKKKAGLAWRYMVLFPMWIFIFIFALASYVKYHRLKAIHVRPLKQSGMQNHAG
jgi:hypothetical protein